MLPTNVKTKSDLFASLACSLKIIYHIFKIKYDSEPKS